MKWRPWFGLLMPTVLIGVAWMALSGLTTFYISWLDSRHQEIMTENVTSIRAAAEMQHALWELHVAADKSRALAESEPYSLEPSEQYIRGFRVALNHAQAATSIPGERRVVSEIDQRFANYLTEFDKSRAGHDSSIAFDRAAVWAVEIARLCDQLRLMNERRIEQRTIEHRAWTNRIGWIRLLFPVLGPMIGVWLGYKVASGFQRRLAAIHVTLEGVSGELGKILVEPSSGDNDLDAIDRQVRSIAGRLHEVVLQLEGARRDATRNERLATVGQLAAGVAHELRNPLTAVKLLVQTAAHKTAAEGRNLQQLVVAQEEISRMERTIQSLLDFAKPVAVQRIPHDLCETLRRAINLVQGRASQQGVQIQPPDDDAPLTVVGDPEQLHQVFVNLLLNGMDAMPGGGLLTLELHRHDAELDHRSFCNVTIIDQGTGIPAGVLDHIFEPFVTTKTGGTGLGLAISSRLVDEHGGQLTAGNHPDGGAVFTVTLPCTSGTQPKGLSELEAKLG